MSEVLRVNGCAYHIDAKGDVMVESGESTRAQNFDQYRIRKKDAVELRDWLIDVTRNARKGEALILSGCKYEVDYRGDIRVDGSESDHDWQDPDCYTLLKEDAITLRNWLNRVTEPPKNKDKGTCSCCKLSVSKTWAYCAWCGVRVLEETRNLQLRARI